MHYESTNKMIHCWPKSQSLPDTLLSAIKLNCGDHKDICGEHFVCTFGWKLEHCLCSYSSFSSYKEATVFHSICLAFNRV